MKNITVTIDDETYRAARVRAAELGTSVSVLVKDYLQGLLRYDAAPVVAEGVREMQMSFTAEPSPFAIAQGVKGPEGQPYFVNEKWTFTKDGKPRKPGSLRNLKPLPDDWDVWPPEILASFDAWPYDDPGFDPLPFDDSMFKSG